MKIEVDDNIIKIETEGGKITARILSDDLIDYELDGLPEERITEFYRITKYHDIVLIDYLFVNDECRGQGIAKLLMIELENFVKGKDCKFMYLNACPILCENGLDLEELESFYIRNGFNVFLNQGSNTLMVKSID